MSGAPKYIIGELVQLGTPEGSDQPRALIHCKEGDIAAVKYAPMLRRVAIVPLEELNGSDVPPIVAECVELRAEVERLTQDRDEWKAKHWKAHDDFQRLMAETSPELRAVLKGGAA
jgi:hypothetical protein